MEEKEANFIYMNGFDYHEKIITFEESSTGIEVIGTENIRYSAFNVSKSLNRAMSKEIGIRLRRVLDENPYHIERITFDKSNATKQLIIIGKNSLVVKHGSYCDGKIFRKFQRYFNGHQAMLFAHDLSQHEIYQPLIQAFKQMMDGTIKEEELRKVCSVVPNDVYLEILSVFGEIGGVIHTSEQSYEEQICEAKFYEESKEKVKSLLGYLK